MNLTTREVAAALGVSLRTAQRYAKTGKLTATKNEAGRWVITLDADLSDYKPAQVDKARTLIEDGGILPTSRPGFYKAVSSDGVVTYLVHRAGCTCPAGQRGKHTCYHRIAVEILTAARRAA